MSDGRVCKKCLQLAADTYAGFCANCLGQPSSISLMPSAPTGRVGLTDAELVAVAALAQVDALSMTAENANRIQAGMAPAYAGFTSDAIGRLEAELRRRGVL